MMLVLLDTHILIWALADTARLPTEAGKLISDAGNDIRFSAASIWEIAIKVRLGRVRFAFEPERILNAATASGWTEMVITAMDALRVRRLPDHHTAPFDRLLVVQAVAAGAVLLTSDGALPIYSPLVRRV